LVEHRGYGLRRSIRRDERDARPVVDAGAVVVVHGDLDGAAIARQLRLHRSDMGACERNIHRHVVLRLLSVWSVVCVEVGGWQDVTEPTKEAGQERTRTFSGRACQST
jgi:hypothetical protein